MMTTLTTKLKKFVVLRIPNVPVFFWPPSQVFSRLVVKYHPKQRLFRPFKKMAKPGSLSFFFGKGRSLPTRHNTPSGDVPPQRGPLRENL
jgi:hypothetical protein